MQERWEDWFVGYSWPTRVL